jgi:uncharacterized membrane protein
MAQKPPQKNNRNSNQQIFAAQQTVTHYQGAVPHPDILRGMDDLVPGTAARLIKLAEEESAHRRKLELMALDANIATQQKQLELGSQQNKSVFRSDFIGQLFGLVVCLFAIAAAAFLGLEGHDGLAAAIAAIPTAAIIKAFTLKKK